MPDPAATPLPLCPAADLAEGGRALVWDVLLWGQPARAFVLRHGGALRGYINRCAHVPIELDWLPGRFFDASGDFLICATHGAMYVPGSGYCVEGPCRGARLEPVAVIERDGGVFLKDDND